MNWIFQIGAPNSRAALADPALRRALVESGRRIRQHVDSLPVRPGNDSAPGRPRVRGLAGRGDAERARSRRSGTSRGCRSSITSSDYADVPVLHITGWYDSWTRQVTMNYEALSQGQEIAAAAGDRPLGARRPGLERRGRGRVHQRGRRSTCWRSACGGTTAGCAARRTAWTTTRRSCSTSWAPATTAARRPAGSSTAASGVPSANGPRPGPRPTTLYLHADGTPLERPPALADRARTTYTFDPRHPVPTIGGNISSNQGLIDQRRLRPAAARRHPRGRQSAAALRAPRRPGVSDGAAGGRPRGHRHGRGQALGRLDGAPTPTSPPS